jgi:hypothetical protein
MPGQIIQKSGIGCYPSYIYGMRRNVNRGLDSRTTDSRTH